MEKNKTIVILCALSSIIGFNYLRNGSLFYIFSSVKNVAIYLAIFLLMIIIFNIIFKYIFRFFDWSDKKLELKSEKKWLLRLDKILQTDSFPLFFLIILVCWLPLVLISYPGGTCIDINYQIYQGWGVEPYSTWQPLFLTLLIEGYIKIGALYLNSYNYGLFLFIGLQCVVLASVLSHSIQLLIRRKAKPQVIAIILAVYCFVPIYPNFASMAIKDTLYGSFFLLYILYFLDMCEAITARKSIYWKKLFVLFTAGVMMCLMRNNGIYSIIISLLVILGVSIKNRYLPVKAILAHMGIVMFYFLLFATMKIGLQAEDLGSREILSIPMQQTARYSKEYYDEITDEEWEVLGEVFLNPRELKELYNPDISDPVKSTFIVSATNSELIEYFKLYVRQFVKHPGVYFDAFLHHSYGWFYLGADNAIRHEGKLPQFSNTLLSVNSDYTVTVIYGILQKFPPYFILQNIGFYLWFNFALMIYVKKRGIKSRFFYFSPILVSVLICIAAPAFYLNARYALPIVFSTPYYYGFFVTKNNR